MAQRRRGPIIGRGSSATVTLASSSSGELFAVKSADLCNSNLLQHEQRILSTLDCPQIVTCLGFEVTRRHYNLLLEYATGGSLSDHIKNHGGRLDEPAVQSRTSEILTGLSYLHSRGIVHCDIKPQNILIGSDGRAKIADFGCARRMDEASYQVKGTPMFMAPEVARGEDQGPAADVWAIGCTVLEMLTGCPSWLDDDPMTALHRIAFSTAVPEIPSWISDEGTDFLRKCLLRDPRQRWTVNQLLKHPFAKLCSTKNNQDFSSSSITPNSMLDRNMWEVFSQEQEEDERTFDDSKDRIRDLERSCSGGPDWTWDGSWVTIRSNEECSMVSMPDYDAVNTTPSQATSSGSGSTQDVENLFLEFQTYNPVHDNSDSCLECKNSFDVSLGTNKYDTPQLSSCKTNLIGFSNNTYGSGNLFYERYDYILTDHDCYDISEWKNGSEMHHPCCCKIDIVWFTYKSNDTRKSYKPTLHSHCLHGCFNS